jgi:hypothetical protein
MRWAQAAKEFQGSMRGSVGGREREGAAARREVALRRVIGLEGGRREREKPSRLLGVLWVG